MYHDRKMTAFCELPCYFYCVSLFKIFFCFPKESFKGLCHFWGLRLAVVTCSGR